MARFSLSRPRVGYGLSVTFAVVLLLLLMPDNGHRLRAQPPDPCAAVPVNPIACENSKPGNPASEWDISGAGSGSIEGFATDISVNKGQTVGFKVNTTAASYRIDIYRLGYYAGNGARLQAQILTPTATVQPACLTNATTGLIDCGNWSQSASWAVPSTAVSGIYIGKLVAGSATNHIVFIVRDDTGNSDLLFQTSDTTWQAYNRWGGNSLYVGSPAGRAYKVSYNRPFTTRGTGAEDWLFNAEYPMVRWLEANGYNVSYFTGADSDRRGAEILEHKVFLSVGHDEYWSGQQRTNVEAARAAGVDLAFFSGNEVFWKTRWENSIDGTNTTYRTLVSYKETHANAKIDPLTGVWTGTWRDPRFSPPDDGGRPENALTGQLFTVNCCSYAITVPEPLGKFRFWRNTSVATLGAGATATLSANTLGYEWDEDIDNGFRPAGLQRLSQTTQTVNERLQDYGSTYAPASATHALTLYRHSSGALVFGAGTVQWSWGLDGNHDRGGSTADVRMQQATVNLFADMGAQPSTLQAGLTAAVASADTTRPTTTITAPAAAEVVAANTIYTIAGTAADVGGLVSGVEVSVDGGATWHPATGRASWTYSWATPASGPVTINVRATDDSGNVQSPVTALSVTISNAQAGVLVASYGFHAGSGTAVADSSGNNNNGTLTNATWTTTGHSGGGMTFNGTNALVTVPDSASLDLAAAMTLEAWVRPTALGAAWRTVLLKEAGTNLAYSLYAHDETRPAAWVHIGSNDRAVNGTTALALNTWTHVAATYDGTTMRMYINGTQVATAAQTGTMLTSTGSLRIGGNSIWGEYFAGDLDDVRLYSRALTAAEVVTDMNTAVQPPDTTPPVVASTVPANNATNVNRTLNITATFNEAMNPATINVSTFDVRDSANQAVAGVVTYDPATFTAVFDPVGYLAHNTVYTATIRGGATDPRVKDVTGNAMTSNATFRFTVAPQGAVCPCTLWEPTDAPVAVDFNDSASVELGVKFRSDRAGYITGIRFYKAALNTGTHVGTVWNQGGAAMGQALFTNESASGWQQANFSPAIPVAANTTYTASYLAPKGHYSADLGTFAAARDSVPLHAPDAASTPNGVYLITPTGGYPNQSAGSPNYWVDVVFVDSVPVDLTPPTVVSQNPASAATGVPMNVIVTATFSEGMDPATVTGAAFELRQGTTLITSTVTYDALRRIVSLKPTFTLAPSTVYTVTLRGGATDPRVKDAAGNALASTMTWSFTTSAAPANDGPGGPILVVTSVANPFGRYFGEILRNEGFNLFLASDISIVTSTVLNSYDVVILGEQNLTPAQVTMFSDWVNAGGNLIAMRPDKQFASLLGLTDAAGVLADKYLLVDQTGPGAGIVSQTMQYHGTADLYTLNGASAVAMLYSNATTATTNPAVTLRSVGSNGGQAAAFSYDLAKSVVYMRQGNPAWAGQERDSIPPIRSNDMFYGGAPGDWIDLNKVAIPQADEQQRLLANMIISMNRDRKPLPHFWYLPRFGKAAIVMTGDDHALGGTAGRFDAYTTLSPAGCNVANWECIRSTSYIYPESPLTNAQATSYQTAGFEVALHVTTDCKDFTQASLSTAMAAQIATFRAKYTSVTAPATNRTHCIPFSDWASHPTVQRANSIRFDTNYYYYPGTWILDRPGLFTGSGMPMRFADVDGTTIDVYQAVTQMTDESGQTFPMTVNTLLDRALGAEGYYGVFTANMHTDNVAHAGSDAIVNAAIARGVPVVSSKQMLTWLDGRNGSAFGAVTRSNNTLTFTITQGTGATGLYALLPIQGSGGPLSALTRAGSAVSYTTQTIKGEQYAVFAATAGSYTATFSQPPETTITASPAAQTNSTNASFSFTATPATGATFECTLDGAAFAACTSPRAYSGLALGNHTFQVRAINTQGTDPTPATFTWLITTSPPDTSITSMPAATTSSTSATFTFVSIPDGATFQCALDGAAFAACTTPRAYTGLALGSHTFSVRATNAAGNDATPATYTWTILAAQPPETTITSSPPASTPDTNASFSFTATPTDATFECSLDGGSFAACTSPRTYSSLAVGPHSFSVRGVNTSGVDPTPATYNWTIAATGCPCSLWAATAAPVQYPDAPDASAVEVGVKFQSDRGGLIRAIRFYKSAANTGVHVGNLWTSGGSLLGTVTFSNETASGWQEALLPTAVSIQANTTYVVSYSTTVGHYSADVGYFNTQLTNAPLRGLATGASGGNGVYVYGSGFPTQTFDGANYWVDVVFADAGDLTPPTVVSTNPVHNATGIPQTAAVTAVFSEDINPSTVTTTTFELRDAGTVLVPATVSYNAATRTATLQPSSALPAPATYTARLIGGTTGSRIMDLAGNALASTVAITFTTATPPDTTLTSTPPATTTSTSASFSFTATPSAGATFQCSLDGAAYAACTSPTAYSGLATSGHTFNVRAVSSAGTDPTPASFTWTITPPVPDTTITSTPPATTTDTNATFAFTSTPAGATFECSLDAAAYAACTTPRTYSSLAVGGHTFNVRAVNGGGTDPTPATFSWTVQALVVPETTLTATPTVPTTSTSASFSFTATPAGATFQCSLDGAAYTTCTSPTSYTGLSVSSHTFNVRGVNAAGTDATPATFTWTINPPPPDTTLTAMPPVTTTSTSASFSFTSTPAGATFECSLDAAAYAACVSPQPYTGLLVGNHTFNVRAVNAGGADPTPATFTWTIQALVVPDTTITTSPPATTTSTSASFTFTATPSGDATFECSLDAGGYAACTSPASYTALAATSHTFRVRAVNPAGTDATPATYTWTITTTVAGLVAAYGFEEGTGTSTADLSGNANTGTLNSATWSTAGRFGNALSFNGTNATVLVADANSLDLTSALTVEAWVRPSVLSSWNTVLMKEVSGGLAYALYAHNGTRPTGWLRNGTTERGLDGTAALAANTWTHLAMTYDGANVRLYVNGTQVATRAQTGAVATSTNPLRIGGNSVWGEYFNGLIDEVRIYNRVLTAAEIGTDMNTPVKP